MKANTKRSKSKAQSTVTKLRVARALLGQTQGQLLELDRQLSDTIRTRDRLSREAIDAARQLDAERADFERRLANARSDQSAQADEAIKSHNKAVDLEGRLSTMTFERSEARTAHRFVCGQLAIALRERNEARAALVKTIGVAAFPQPPVTAASPEASS